MEKYKASYGYIPTIRKIKILRETKNSVFFTDGSRVLKETRCYSWCDTWVEARDFLLEIYTQRAKSIRRELQVANSYIGNIKGMKEKI